jgi:hypothetical protein
MTLFSASLTEFSGKRAVELRFSLNRFDRPRRLLLVIDRELRGTVGVPFAYQFFDENATRSYPMVIVVAAPGVSVVEDNFPETYVAVPGIPAVHLYRVQDPAVVPPLGADLSSFDLVTSSEVNAPLLSVDPRSFTAGAPNAFPENYFKIDRLPYGVVIKHFASTQEFVITVPNRPPSDSQARFAFWIDPQGIPGSVERPLLRIVKTPVVEVVTSDAIFETNLFRLSRSPLSMLRIGQVFDVFDLDAVPAQGDDIIPRDDWLEIQRLQRVRPLIETLGMAAFDVAVGLTPYVGVFVAFAELAYGLEERWTTGVGRDKWGRPLSTGDLWVMGVATLLPYLAGPLHRRAVGLVRSFGERAAEAERAISALREAGISPEEAKLIEEVALRIRSGQRISDQIAAQVAAIAARIRAAPGSLDSLLNGNASGFLRTDLQEAYQAYSQPLLRRNATPLKPREWALKQTTGAPRRILNSLLGENYVARTRGVYLPDRVVSIPEIPRPPSYPAELELQHRRLLADNQARLVERLTALDEAARSVDPIIRYDATRRVSSGLFSILKGNVGEIFSFGIQRSILQKIAAEVPEARIISGIRMRVGGKLSPISEFSDNIIAVERGGNLYIYAVFEVKAGYKGGQEATEQIFDWIERKLTDGAQLVVPRGAHTIDASGVSASVAFERVFTYRPGSTQSGQVVYLASAERHLITAQGASLLGLNSAMQVAAKVTRHELEVSSEVIDHLCGRIIADWSPGVPLAVVP